ncbi:MAG: 6,7-dimethyl-8-ribityllumazine synthase [Opitutales bacterium]
MSFDPPEPESIDPADLYVCVVASRYNERLIDELLDRVLTTLEDRDVPEENVQVYRVPGSNELPYAAFMNAVSGQFDVVIALGVIIAGDTNHHDLIARSTGQAFHEIGLRTEVPVINGVLTVNSEAQAKARVSGNHDRGREFANAALEMASMKVQWVERLDALEDQLEERTSEGGLGS